MSNLVKLVEDKLNQYGFIMIRDYPVEDDHMFETGDMMIFVNDEKKTLSISFKASTRPEDVSKQILILKEIDEISFTYIMDSFTYDAKSNLITGDDAHEFNKRELENKAVIRFAQFEAYNDILISEKCFNC